MQSLADHIGYLSTKITFLLDATLGMINNEQNTIIKIFSVLAVALMPPTLVGTIYGMNFKHMPELELAVRLPVALGLMVVSARAAVALLQAQGLAVVVCPITDHQLGGYRRMPEIYVYAIEGRTLDQKRALVKEITDDAVVRSFNVGPGRRHGSDRWDRPRPPKAKGGVLFSDKLAWLERSHIHCIGPDLRRPRLSRRGGRQRRRGHRDCGVARSILARRALRKKSMDLGIKGEKAIVCAASKGLGKGCATALAREGVDVYHLRARRRRLNATAKGSAPSA